MNRDELIQEFLSKNNLGDRLLVPVENDASFRKYFRIKEKGLIVMDAPSELGESIESFINIDSILLELGLSAPKIYAADYNHGFLLLEDFGHTTFKYLMLQRSMGRPYRMGDRLYKKAISVILHIKSKWSNNIELGKNLPRYSIEELLKEARLFIDWYLIKHRQIQVQAKDIDEFESIISNLFKIISPGFDTLVLRDYHVDNLFFLKGRGGGFKNIGLIDFQDALIGSATYDLVSLIEDVRWPVNRVPYKNKNLRDDLFDFFVSHGKLDEEQVNKEACFFSVQRNLKILGIFCRLKYRDGKESYIDYLKNAKNILAVHLSNPLMEDLNKWVRKFDSKIVEGS
ncbi:MAG: hypothetical protein CMN79_01750 [Spirochaetales bacterium]|nr:hypothetical protein [Spirochaetales bacterium]|tara:strand:+ start:2266 stop:3291 length:1026 start_codon:yes stop_codon:yes gene_type:complete